MDGRAALVGAARHAGSLFRQVSRNPLVVTLFNDPTRTLRARVRLLIREYDRP
jgi:hypothetical protein